MLVLGVNSGTSVDSIDLALCEFVAGEQPGTLVLRLLAHTEYPYPVPLREQVLEYCRVQQGTLEALTRLHFQLGELFAKACQTYINEWSKRWKIDLIASHGQTIYHLVGETRATWQMGEAALIAQRTGITTVADFRVADIAAGGQGAPLVPYLDSLLLRDERLTRAVQNIGGIANVTFLPARANGGEAYAFDTGPGNALIDYGARFFSHGAARYDRGGEMARTGQVDHTLLNEVLAHPYFQLPPPKSTGRELFGDAFAAELIAQAQARSLAPADVMATLTAITAESIAQAYRRFGPHQVDEMIVSGGGSENPVLLAYLQRALPEVQILRSDTIGLPVSIKEAVAFALLGYAAIYGQPANVPMCTGAHTASILGKISPGSNYRQLYREIAQDLLVGERHALYRIQLENVPDS